MFGRDKIFNIQSVANWDYTSLEAINHQSQKQKEKIPSAKNMWRRLFALSS
jgi:hypothetical protein